MSRSRRESGPPPAAEASPVPAGEDATSPSAGSPAGAGSGAPAVPTEGPGDHDLIRAAQAGDEQAFAELVRRHERRAYRVARNLVPSREDALDLSQEAFLRVYRNLERFDFRHEFTTWLYRIVTNLGIDHLRKRRPAVSTASLGVEEEAEIDLPDGDAPPPSERMESRETAERVRECIDALAPHFRTVLTLRELEGLACTEIADIVGATHVTVRWRLHRGRKLFQEEWERRERADERAAAAAAGRAPRSGAPEGTSPSASGPRPNAGESGS